MDVRYPDIYEDELDEARFAPAGREESDSRHDEENGRLEGRN
jgi:hypothetical protein